MAMSFRVAKTAINEADRDRLLCLYLNTVDGQINWEKAATEYGSASVNSFRVMVGAAKKNLRNATEKLEKEANGDGTGDGTDAATSGASAPTTKNKKSHAKKRTNEEADGGAEADAEANLPAKKGAKRGRKVSANENGDDADADLKAKKGSKPGHKASANENGDDGDAGEIKGEPED